MHGNYGVNVQAHERYGALVDALNARTEECMKDAACRNAAVKQMKGVIGKTFTKEVTETRPMTYNEGREKVLDILQAMFVQFKCGHTVNALRAEECNDMLDWLDENLPKHKYESSNVCGLSKRGLDWNYFSNIILRHIEEYAVPQYGDKGADPASEYTVEKCVEEIRKYAARHGRNARGEVQDRQDLLKIAHYAQMAYNGVTVVE